LFARRWKVQLLEGAAKSSTEKIMGIGERMALQIQSINCPNCGAPLETSDLRPSEIQCSHCNSMIELSSFDRSKLDKPENALRGTGSIFGDDQASKRSTTCVIASLVLGSVSIIGIVFPTLCASLNIAGLVAAWLGRHSPRRNLFVTAIVINGIGLLLNIGIIIWVIIYSRQAASHSALQGLIRPG
jgi:hypothetical protein